MDLIEKWLKSKFKSWVNMRHVVKDTVENSITNVMLLYGDKIKDDLISCVKDSREYKNIIFLYPVVKESVDKWILSLSTHQLLELNIIELLDVMSYWLFCDRFNEFACLINGGIYENI